MLISYSHRFIFFHVPKVAGISIREALKNYAEEPGRFKINRPNRQINGNPNPLYEMWKSSLLHAKAIEVKKELTEKLYKRFFKFAFVRNPWDWQISMYHFILKEPAHVRHHLVKSMAGFDEYLDWVIQNKNPYPKGATKFQKEILTDKDGQLMVNFIGRYETLEDDFKEVCDYLKISASLPRLNRTDHKDYRSYYKEQTIKKVEEHFKEDIELFGYKFDGFQTKAPGVGKLQPISDETDSNNPL
ncbi:MAG: sulfotransferase family 2 domain-containing protein [Desulfosalsimonadaceae bacterium]|nr:sulfotransferase family 2 domain-containing protein [Desulfosalsimonadaceae bacterium]